MILDRNDNTRRGSRDGRNGADAFLVADWYRFSLWWNKFASKEVELSRGADDPVRNCQTKLVTVDRDLRESPHERNKYSG